MLERVIEEFGIISVKGRSDYCPFCHSDSDGVFSFNDEVFHCFSCGKAGDAVTFVRELKSVGYYEAVKIIYEDILKQQIPHNIASKMSKIREIEAKYLNCSLSPVAKEYLQKRGITDATIDAGGIISNGNNIIFPIKDIHGNIIGDIKKNMSARYLISPNSDIFVKGDNFYNQHQAFPMAINTCSLYITEGVFDALSLLQENRACVASLGCSLTDNQISKLRELYKKDVDIILAWDNDAPATNAIIKLREKLKGIDIYINEAPQKFKDANEALMSGESFVGEANTHIDLWVFRKLVEKKKRKESKYMFFQEYVKSVGNMSVRQDILEEAEKIMGIKINLDTKVDRSFIGNVHSPLDCWEEIVSNRGISDFSFRWGFFNHYFPSIIKSEVMVVGGYSGTGKTMMAGNMATDAIKGGKKVLIFSMEMKKGALLKRMIADGIDTPYRELGQHLQESKDYLHQINEGLRIIDENNLSIEQICGYIEATITSGFTPDIIIFDYLQYIKGCSEFAVVAESAKAMKAIAKKYNVFVVCLSQLNRGFFGSKKVHIGLLKGAGDIEASADYIILITNEEEGSPNVTATIGKNRNGAKGASIPMIFDTEMMRFE